MRYVAIDGSGVSVIAPGSAEFQSALTQLTAGATNELLQECLPYSIILRNNSGRTIVALTVVYLIKNELGKLDDHQYFLGTVLRYPGRLFAPGESRFVCPVSAIYDAVNKRRVTVAGPVPAEITSQARQHLERYRVQQGIEILLDSVVFDDGEIVGEDRSRTLEFMNASIQAVSNLSRSITGMTKEGALSYLKNVVNRPSGQITSYSQVNHFERELRTQAAVMLKALSVSRTALDAYLGDWDKYGLKGIFRRGK